MKTAVVINHDHMGHGDAALGSRILKTFLQKSRTLHDLEAVLLYNSGVKLVGPDSPVLPELALLDANGVDIIPCGTCLKHFDVTPEVGAAGSMDGILTEMNQAEKVITL